MEHTIRFYRTFSHPEIFEEFIPEGYKLVEKDDHKKRRLEIEQAREETNIESYKKYLSESEEKLKEIKKELKELG